MELTNEEDRRNRQKARKAEQSQLLEWIAWSFEDGNYHTVDEMREELVADQPINLTLKIWDSQAILRLLVSAAGINAGWRSFLNENHVILFIKK